MRVAGNLGGGRPNRRARIVSIFALAGAALVGLPAGAGGAPAEPLGHAGRWITDAEGKVVTLHGFNTVPFKEPLQPVDIGMGADNAQWLSDNGFNTIRLGLFYARVEPEPGQYDAAYLADYLRVQQELADEGIFTLLDMHQDQLHPRFGPGTDLSRGFPDWFIKEDGLLNTQTSYPQGYLTNPALNRAYDNIWNDFDAGDGTSVQDHYAEGWRRIADVFEERSHLLGYDFFNEPWPGSPAASCISPSGCPPGGFDQTLLTDFNRKLTTALRAEDPQHLIFYEPNLQFDFGAQTRVGDPQDDNAGFSFHGYCLSALYPGSPSPQPCEVGEELVFDNADAHTEETGSALLASELGFDPESARRLMRLADNHMVSWQWWDYYADAGILYPDAAPILIRPFPQVVAGTPVSWSFDDTEKAFDLTYLIARARGEGEVGGPVSFPAGAVSEVFVPREDYPDGYGVSAAGAEVVSDDDAALLELSSCAGADVVQVQVVPAERPPTSCAGAPASCEFVQRGTTRADRLVGGPFGDRLLGRTGSDRLRGKAGDDCLRGGNGGDWMRGGRGEDQMRGGRGQDLLKAWDGEEDVVNCGPGRDRAVMDATDTIRNCERTSARRSPPS